VLTIEERPKIGVAYHVKTVSRMLLGNNGPNCFWRSVFCR